MVAGRGYDDQTLEKFPVFLMVVVNGGGRCSFSLFFPSMSFFLVNERPLLVCLPPSVL